jgi:hypothetical protein
MSDTGSKSWKGRPQGPNGEWSKSSGRSPLDEAIDKLADADDWEDTSVNVHVQIPKNSMKPTPLKYLEQLPPWGRVVILVLVIALVWQTGLGAHVASFFFPGTPAPAPAPSR